MIVAILLAAGGSSRMGRPKLALPAPDGLPLVRHVAETFHAAGIGELIVVTGADREVVEAALVGTPVRLVLNPDHAGGEMLSSIKVGLRQAERAGAGAALLHPADVAFVAPETIRALLRFWDEERPPIAAPSYRQRRGHPILIGRELWADLLALAAHQTLRDFLRQHADRTRYVVVDDPGVVQDVDTPEDYRAVQGRS